MRDHERDRIAAAMNMLRPDWPTRQLQTLLDNQQLTDRPRRDVCVALAWVACEAGTANPYRVLEAGPWWKAAAADGTTSSNRDNPDKAHRCSVCSLSEARCRQLWSADHDYEPATVDRKRRPEQIHQIVQATKAELALTKPTETEETPVRDHDTCEEAINAALANGNDGQAEFLAVRCDREHGEQMTEEAS